MNITRLNDAKEYPTTGHYDMRALRLHGVDTSNCQDFTLGLSHFLPGGRTDYMEASVELIYCVVEGELELTTEEGTTVLRKYDSVHFNIGDKRSVFNATNMPAAMLVVAGMKK